MIELFSWKPAEMGEGANPQVTTTGSIPGPRKDQAFIEIMETYSIQIFFIIINVLKSYYVIYQTIK